MTRPPLTIARRRVRAALLAVAVLCVTGCWEERVIRDDWASLRAMSEQYRDPKDRAGGKSGPSDLGYGIILAKFEGDNREDQARLLMQRLRREANLSDVRMLDQGSEVLVYRGPYDDPSTDTTRQHVESTRAIVLDGRRPFATAGMSPLWAVTTGAPTSPLDLRHFPGSYTLQVAYFDDAIGPEFRKAAESAAAAMRKEGAEAYFYHGPLRSLVTVGIFGENDVIREVVKDESGVNHFSFSYSPRVREMRDRYPWNKPNGQEKSTNPDGTPGPRQRSSLVRVPQQ